MRKIIIIAAVFIIIFVALSTPAIGNENILALNSIEFVDCCKDELVYIDVENLIDTLSFDNLEKNQYLKRARNMEDDLYTLIYQCDEGNNVAYIFQYPVKYIDSTGSIKDISTGIKEFNQEIQSIHSQNDGKKDLSFDRFEYASIDNAFGVYYNNCVDIKDTTVLAVKDEWAIGITPYEANNTCSNQTNYLEYNNNSAKNERGEYAGIKYNGVFGLNTELQYNTTYTGYKETIILHAPTVENTFSFKLSTGGLVPTITDSGSIGLCNTNGEAIAEIAPIFVFDSSAERKCTLNNYYTLDKCNDNTEEYILTLNVEKAFIEDETLVYPVFIDPTLSFNTASSIDDAPIYSGLPNHALGSNYFNCIGYVDDLYKTGSLMVKFPGLKNSTFFNGLDDIKVNSVTYNAYKVGGGNGSYTSTIKAYHYTGAIWNESTVTYNSANIANNTGTHVASVNMQNNKKYQFDITLAALAWKNGTKNYDKGLVLKNYSSTTNHSYERDIASVEYAINVDGNVMPYIQVVFNNGGISRGFSTLDLAAKEFAETVYSSSLYVRFEYAATLFKLNSKYYYYNVHSGKPHGVLPAITVPSGASYEGYVHTHPNSEGMSTADENWANNHGGRAYVVTPSRKVKRYDSNRPELGVVTVYTNVSLYELNEVEKTDLVNEFSAAWNTHITAETCDFNCPSKTWPNE